jgi:hypothetical protein
VAKKTSKRRDDDEDELPDDRSDEVESLDDEDDDPVARRKPRDDAWTGLLAIALLGLIGASVLFYLDHAALSAQQVQPPTFTLPGLGGPAAAPPPG